MRSIANGQRASLTHLDKLKETYPTKLIPSSRYVGGNENFVLVVLASPFDSNARSHSGFCLLTSSTPISRQEYQGEALAN
jgi:hypothetical protein